MAVNNEVRQYLGDTLNAYQPGQHEYFARLALEQALLALEEGNYGIGALAVVSASDMIKEFPARNAMIIGGIGVVDHAETRALLDVKSGLISPNAQYSKSTNEHTKKIPEGISVFGTLEPCPMCACTLTNAGAKLSVSTVLDGEIMEEDGYKISSGGANIIGEKSNIQPRVWKWIQEAVGLKFELLDTQDRDLVSLSQRIFEDTREEIDARLANR